MEGKERYGCRYIRGEFDVFIDNETDKYLTIQEVKHLLNQQDKRIKELEEENNFLEKRNEELMIDRRDICLERNDIFEENQQLKQQLYDLPKKIIGQIEKCFTEYLPLKDRTGAWFYGKLNEILKKFGGEI